MTSTYLGALKPVDTEDWCRMQPPNMFRFLRCDQHPGRWLPGKLQLIYAFMLLKRIKVILSNQKKTRGGFAQGHRKELLYVKDVECRVHWKKRLDWAINKSQKYHSTTTIAGFIIHDRIAIMGDFMSLIVYPPNNQRPVFYWSLGRGTFELDFKQPWRVAERFGFTRLHYRLKLNQRDMIQLRWTKKNTRN